MAPSPPPFPATPNVTVSVSPDAVYEGANATFTVVRDGDFVGDLVVTLDVSNPEMGAFDTLELVSRAANVTITDGQSFVLIPVRTAANAATSGANSNLTVSIDGGTGYAPAAVDAGGQAELTIMDTVGS
jgi:hypothetical protein